MGFATSRKLYEALPLSVKRSVCLLPFGWIAGKAYRVTLKRAANFETADRKEIRAYQERALGEMLRFATDQVPVYRPLRSAVERFSPFDALKEFPIFQKDALQEDMQQYLPREIDRIGHYEISTGGTSGNQLKFYVDNASQSIDTAFVHRLWRRMGYTPRCRKATFRGVAFPHLEQGVYWQHNPIYNELQFSPFHMTEKNMAAYLEQIADFKPPYFHGYPSAIDLLAEFVLRNGLENELPPIKAVFLVSEGITTAQRERIEKAFRTRVFSFYGHSERLVLGGECEKNTTYHHFPDYGILEIVAEDGSPCDKEGERGEIVGTGLLSRSMPLIRYRTGDSATCLESRCECGRQWDRFDNVEGRWKQDMIIGRNGARMSIAALNMHGAIFDKVTRYQYFQEREGLCEIRVMVAPGFDEIARTAIEKAYQNKVGDELDMRVCVVDDIPLTARGKLKILDSRIFR
jgi:phenylacetate-CoA ligase